MSESRKAFEELMGVTPAFSFHYSNETAQYVAIDLEMTCQVDEFNVQFEAFDRAWQEQQKKIDEALLELKQKYLELNDRGNDYEDPVSICQAEGIDISIRILEKALQGDTYVESCQ